MAFKICTVFIAAETAENSLFEDVYLPRNIAERERDLVILGELVDSIQGHALQAKQCNLIFFTSFPLHFYQKTTEIRILSERELSYFFQWRNRRGLLLWKRLQG